MLKKFFAIFIAFTLLSNTVIKADGDDEGMWLPLLVQKLNYNKMKAMGLKLTAEQIYSVNKGSLKDAVIALDHGSCTGELVSPDGLFLTNHHCGYGEIQAHSTVKHDYLTDGFWAKKRSQELVNPDKTVSFLIRVEDVTEKINSKLKPGMSEEERDAIIKQMGQKLSDEATKGTHYEAKVQPFFKGNNFYLFVYETFLDVRLVGAPPSSIGKYGADTDNWMWPRHTGDFSMFRIYCGPDGKPAKYSKNNVPYHPKHFLPISLKGTEKGDFAMVMGYPGTTTRYMSSWGVDQTIRNENAIRIKLRGIKQKIMKARMDKSDKIRIQYASKYSRSTNYYKYSIGQNKGLKALNVIGKKKDIERNLQKWIYANQNRVEKYEDALSLLRSSVKSDDKYDKVSNYWFEGFWLGAESLRFARTNAFAIAGAKGDEKAMGKLKEKAKGHFKDYNEEIDKAIFVAMMETYKKDIDKEFYPSFFKEVDEKYDGDFKKYADEVYSKSFFTNEKNFMAALANPDVDAIRKDMMYKIVNDALGIYRNVKGATTQLDADHSKGQRLFVAALLEMEKDKAHYPDANSSMRLTYGTVGDYKVDGKQMPYRTYLSGYMKKGRKGVPKTDEFYVPKRLKKLYRRKNYGQYKDKDGKMPVCFTTNNDITGGNSGSPVINAEGQLIGIAFDGNWEAMSGDIAFEPKLQKCIDVDIRFVLFIIDKYAGATNLIKEMTIIK